MWSIEATLLLICSIAIAIVFLAIITNSKIRQNCVPNFIYSLLHSITSLTNALDGAYTSWEMCQFQVFYWHFDVAANAWLQGVLAYAFACTLEEFTNKLSIQSTVQWTSVRLILGVLRNCPVGRKSTHV